METCVACNQVIVYGAIRRDHKCFCSHACMNTQYPIEFCPRCLAETGEPSDMGFSQAGGCGAGLYNSLWHGNCPDCGSQVARIWIAVLGLPLIPLGRYRVFYLNDFEFMARPILRRKDASA